MAVTWPPSLPRVPLRDGAVEGTGDGRIRHQPDQGPAMVRRRYSAVAKPFAWQVLVTQAQLATFLDFYETTLEGGALPFEHVHPRTGATVHFRFGATSPTWAQVGDAPDATGAVVPHFLLALDLEVLP